MSNRWVSLIYMETLGGSTLQALLLLHALKKRAISCKCIQKINDE